MRHLIKKLSISIFLFFAALSIFAREITVTVIDSDLALPLEGAVIRGWDGNEYACDENGKAVIQAPDGRQSAVQAAYPGYETGRIVIPVSGDSFTIALRLSGVMQGRELVIEASRPGENETQTGRSIAVSGREIAQTAEIGIIEDVMSTIKLLPGVNYSGLFNAQPSIRGGHPGDMNASFDGFYINNPYHWGGGFSIFDPRMVQSAQLSHGVFSVRYGHTISGLLEITSKKPSSTETQFELGINTSAANFNLSLPFEKGGVLIMGRITYYDPVIALAKELSKAIPELEVINFIRTAPYIRSTTVSGNYRFTDSLELSATGFWGMDGMSAYFLNSSRSNTLDSDTSADFDYANFQGFLTASLVWNPRADMLLKFSLGTGYEDAVIDGRMAYEIHNKKFSQAFLDKYSDDLGMFIPPSQEYQYSQDSSIDHSDFLYNAQARADFDWELANDLLVAAGVQEMFSLKKSSGSQHMSYDVMFSGLGNDDKQKIKAMFPSLPDSLLNYLIIEMPAYYSPDLQNSLLSSSAYILGEYSLFSGRLKIELGLRLDHFVIFGKDFTVGSDPVINPRLNIDFNILKNAGPLVSLDLSAGTGLFSSVNENIFDAEKKYGIDYMKPNRSWTTIIGVRFLFPESLSLNIETYYKYIFNRMYIPVSLTTNEPGVDPRFDGEGTAWGIDIMLHKVQSRFWDGWLSYSFNWTKYRDPGGKGGGLGYDGGNRGSGWYFPSFHRFHNLNLVFNIRPVQSINIYIRFGLASGVQQPRRTGNGPQSVPVLIYDRDNPGGSYFIEKYSWPSVTDEENRTTPSLPMDIKFSIFGSNRNGKTRYEVYAAVENVLSLLYSAGGNTSFNQYTGEVDTGSSSARYEIPIPIPSFGFKICY
jgi:hypothetical protein